MDFKHKVMKYSNEKTGCTPHVEEPRRSPQLFSMPNRVVVFRSSFVESRPSNSSDQEAIKQHLAKELGMIIFQNGGIEFDRKIDESNGYYKTTANIAIMEVER